MKRGCGIAFIWAASAVRRARLSPVSSKSVAERAETGSASNYCCELWTNCGLRTYCELRTKRYYGLRTN